MCVNFGLRDSVKKSLNVSDSMSFRGKEKAPEIVRNQLKIYLSQDIFAPKLKVRMPESDTEKEVLLEILTQRLKLDKLTKITNERGNLKNKISEALNLMDKEPQSSKLKTLLDEIKKKGNLDTVFETYSKKIQNETKRNRAALDYFEGINTLEDEYLKNNLISMGKIMRFWKDINRKNINKNGKYSTQDLIDMISGKSQVAAEKSVVKKVKPIVNKDVLEKTLAEQYENFLKRNINIYSGKNERLFGFAQMGRDYVKRQNIDALKRFNYTDRQVDKICEEVERMYKYKVSKLYDIDIYPVGIVWNDLKKEIPNLKHLDNDLKNAKSSFLESKELIAEKEAKLDKLRKEWLENFIYSMELEEENRGRFAKQHLSDTYSYLMDDNADFKIKKALYSVCKENNNTLPEKYWDGITDGTLKNILS